MKMMEDVTFKHSIDIRTIPEKIFEFFYSLVDGASYGATALIWASVSGNLDLVQLFLKKGANINVRTKDGVTALYMASQAGNSNIVELLKSKGAEN